VYRQSGAHRCLLPGYRQAFPYYGKWTGNPGRKTLSASDQIFNSVAIGYFYMNGARLCWWFVKYYYMVQFRFILKRNSTVVGSGTSQFCTLAGKIWPENEPSTYLPTVVIVAVPL